MMVPWWLLGGAPVGTVPVISPLTGTLLGRYRRAGLLSGTSVSCASSASARDSVKWGTNSDSTDHGIWGLA